MHKKILNHYLKYSLFTYPGLYENYLKSLPDDPRKIGRLLRWSFIHRTTLDWGNKRTNSDLKFGDMTKVPWYRQVEDDNLPTASAMLAELFRRDSRGLTFERKVEDKLVLTCRFISILAASILKAKGIPARVRSGFVGYWPWANKNYDHWINEYWSKKEKRWIAIDIDSSFHKTSFDWYDMPHEKFEYSADVWLNIRKGKANQSLYKNADGHKGLLVVAWELFYDFHCLMNSEIIYPHIPKIVIKSWEFKKLSEEKLKEIDNLAQLMQNPDGNFEALQNIWETKREFRLLKGGLL